MGRRVEELVPECVGLSLAVLEGGLTFTLVASDLQAAALDAAQYLDGGPCVDAVEEGRRHSVTIEDLLDEGRWQIYAESSAAVGVASSLSLPIFRGGRVVGGVNLYASTPDAFNGRHQVLADAVGASVQDAVTNADLSFSTRKAAAEAPTRFNDERDIDVALGVIAARRDVEIAAARRRLDDAAQRAGITTVQAARALIRLLDDAP